MRRGTITAMSTPSIPMPARAFHGTAVVRAAFLIALFGGGTGFYGPPVFLHAVVLRTGWPLALVSIGHRWVPFASHGTALFFGAAAVLQLSAVQLLWPGHPAALA